MATQANEYFVITDGTTTATFSDGSAGNTDYRLADGWAPAVAHLSDSQLGGRGPYQDVTEQADILVKGATWTAAKANVGALERLLQQAVRWARGENVAVVLVKWAPKGSTVATTAAPFQAVVLGGAFSFSAKWHQDQATFQTNGRLTFQRRGAWLLSAAVTGSSAATAVPGPFNVTGMALIGQLSPAQVVLKNLPTNIGIDLTDSTTILLTGFQASDLQVVSPFAGSTSTYTNVADTANDALGGSILRYNPTDTTERQTNRMAASGNSVARRFALYAAVRNNSAVSFKVRIRASWLVETLSSLSNVSAYTPYVVIDATVSRPRFVPLGIVSIPSAMTSLVLSAVAAASTGSPTLDVNYIVAQAIDNPYARAVQFTYNSAGAPYGETTMGSPSDIYVDPLPLTDLAPRAYHNRQSTTDTEYLGYLGDAYPVAASTTFSAVLMGKPSGSSNFWRYGASAGSASSPASLTLTVNRYDARVAPE